MCRKNQAGEEDKKYAMDSLQTGQGKGCKKTVVATSLFILTHLSCPQALMAWHDTL
jgi:hypothetical protein